MTMRLQKCQLVSDFSDWPPLGIFDVDSREVVGTACDVETRNMFIAAPTMLAALHLAVERLEINNCEGEEDSAIAELRAAIAKAANA